MPVPILRSASAELCSPRPRSAAPGECPDAQPHHGCARPLLCPPRPEGPLPWPRPGPRRFQWYRSAGHCRYRPLGQWCQSHRYQGSSRAGRSFHTPGTGSPPRLLINSNTVAVPYLGNCSPVGGCCPSAFRTETGSDLPGRHGLYRRSAVAAGAQSCIGNALLAACIYGVPGSACVWEPYCGAYAGPCGPAPARDGMNPPSCPYT